MRYLPNRNAVTAWLLAERERWVLWLPVLLGAGMLGYFALPDEPYAVSMLCLPCLLPVTWWLRRRGWHGWWLGAVAMVFFSGFVWAKIHTDRQDVVMIQKKMNFARVSGTIDEINALPSGYRLTLGEVAIEGMEPAKTPRRIRVKLRGAGDGLMTGDRVKLRAGLLPPSGPVMPGGFDFARFFFFRDIGAVGYAMPPVEMVEKSEAHWRLDEWITAQRQALSERIRRQMKPTEGAVAVALMTGDRAAIPNAVSDAMRDTNLSHILAISGMHMALVTGMVFFAVRFGLVLIPRTQHGRQNKKVAAGLALLAGAGYLAISGLPLSAVRAFVMVALMLCAILLDREVTPMRSLMWAAMMLLLYDPSNLLEPGFQLSFSATAGLIAWYEGVRARVDALEPEHSRAKRVWLYLGGIMMTTVVAEVATTPLVLYHFNTLSLYGLVANLVVMPVVSFWIMPAIVLAFLCMPFGLEWLPLQLVEWGIGAMIAVAQWVAAIPYAQFWFPFFPAWGMVLFMAGGAWMVIWQKRVRWWGALPMVVGLMAFADQHPPDILVSQDLKQIAARVDGQWRMLQGRSQSFVATQWANGMGEAEFPMLKGQSDIWRCDRLGCVYQAGEVRIALTKEQAALPDDCRLANWVLASFYIRGKECIGGARWIDRGNLQRGGAHWGWFEGDTIRWEKAADVQGERPWRVYQ